MLFRWLVYKARGERMQSGTPRVQGEKKKKRDCQLGLVNAMQPLD